MFLISARLCLNLQGGALHGENVMKGLDTSISAVFSHINRLSVIGIFEIIGHDSEDKIFLNGKHVLNNILEIS